MEIHIFDFDGTLFFSPTPKKGFVYAEYGPGVYGRLLGPLTSGGYGWFQSLSTLSPPAVPAEPAELIWYVTPVVNWFRALIAGKPSSCNGISDGQSQQWNSVNHSQEHTNGDGTVKRLFFVMTGRDEKYRRRIEYLLDHIGLLRHIEHVYLKQSEAAGTVEYKLNTFFDVILKWKPQRVFYYEDRYDQGAKFFEGMEQLQRALNPGRDSDVHLCSIKALIDANAANPGSACVIPSVSGEPLVAPFHPPTYPIGGDNNLAHSVGSINYRTMMTREDLYAGDTKLQRLVPQYIRRWLVKTICERNNAFRKSGRGQLSDSSYGANVSSGNISTICVAKELSPSPEGSKPLHVFKENQESASDPLLENIEFSLPLPFSFIMVMIPNEISSRSDKMLTKNAQSALIATLMKEKQTYDALKFHNKGA